MNKPDDDNGLRVAVVDSSALMLLLAIMRDAGMARGRQHSYQECVDAARVRANAIEDEIARNGDNLLLLGGLIELRAFVDQFDDAPPYYRERVEFETRRIAQIGDQIRDACGLDLSDLLTRAAQAEP
ncbi:MAG TPA: hypothetical protein VGH74_07790 [Planctomycetaceae bacterium]|jgi:hypothetical protein